MMVLYSGTTCPYSHRCRFVLFEKGMDFEIRDVDIFAKPEDIALMNPYNEVPISSCMRATSSTNTSMSAFRTPS
jgi:stringent starvation protein A